MEGFKDTAGFRRQDSGPSQAKNAHAWAEIYIKGFRLDPVRAGNEYGRYADNGFCAGFNTRRNPSRKIYLSPSFPIEEPVAAPF